MIIQKCKENTANIPLSVDTDTLALAKHNVTRPAVIPGLSLTRETQQSFLSLCKVCSPASCFGKSGIVSEVSINFLFKLFSVNFSILDNSRARPVMSSHNAVSKISGPRAWFATPD